MAYGEFKVSGDDVYGALTEFDKPSYTRVLNDEGNKLADLIIDRVLDKLQAKFILPDED